MTLREDFECNKSALTSLLSTIKVVGKINNSANDLFRNALAGVFQLKSSCFTTLNPYWRNNILETSESDEERTYYKEIYGNYTLCSIV